ncbi:hypothetical protein F4803DRAFT_542680 [Xylaria telfairii]|nr:hypothetical protein F4803DRAFT_542680 [Xylaria telfairii]
MNISRKAPKASPPASRTSVSSFDAIKIALSEGSPEKTNSTDPLGSNNPTAGSSTDKDWKIIPILNGFVTPRRLAKLPCFMVHTPVRNDDFFGRTSILEEIDELLLPAVEPPSSPSGPSYQKHVVLCGIGGIGKTSIAIEYVFSRRNKFDAIFWIRADEPEKLEQDFGQISSELGLLDPAENSNPVIRRNVVKGWLESPIKAVDQKNDIIGKMEARWLIVFDNADRPDILQDYWPLSSNGAILVTSRDPLSKNSPSIATKAIDVPLLDRQEAAHLLRRLSRVSKDEEGSLKVAAQLDGLPLAISQMAAIIRYQYLTFSDFYDQYKDESDRREFHAFYPTHPRPEARGTIASIWAMEQLDPQTRGLLDICAMLDPDSIQERIFTDNYGLLEHIESFPRTNFAYSASRAQLIQGSLISRNGEKREFRVHRILQHAVQSKMKPEAELLMFFAAVDLILSAWGNTPLVQRHVLSLAKSREELFPHALALRNRYISKYMEQNPPESIKIARLMNESGWFQHERGHSQDIKSFLTLALQICERNPGEDATQVLSDVHYGLAAAANETNNAKECLHHTERLLKLRLEAHSVSQKNDIRLAIAHNEIGIAWIMNHNYEEGLAEFHKSILVYQQLEDYWPSMDTNPRTNMGFTYWVMGHLDQAEKTLLELLHDREKRFGVNDMESYRTGRVYHGLGNICFDQGHFEESETWHQRALSQYQSTLGNNHHKTADLCHRVAKHCLRRGEVDNARTLLDQALQIYRVREAVYQPELARTTFLKAKLELQCGHEPEAKKLFEHARDMREKLSSVPPKPDASLRELDFDEAVTFFSR